MVTRIHSSVSYAIYESVLMSVVNKLQIMSLKGITRRSLGRKELGQPSWAMRHELPAEPGRARR